MPNCFSPRTRADFDHHIGALDQADQRGLLRGIGEIDQHAGLALIDQIEGGGIVAPDQIGAAGAFHLYYFGSRQP